MSSDKNKQVERAYVDAFNSGDFQAVAALCTPNAAIYGVLGRGGLDMAMPIWEELHEAYAIQLRIDDLVAEGDTAAARYTETGTSRAPFRGGPVTHRSYTIVAIEWFKFKDGKIAARWGARDSAAIARQLEGAS